VTTEWKQVGCGVPQGSGISPKAFNIYPRKLQQTSQSSSMQFADDFTISEYGCNLQVIGVELAANLYLIQNYCQELGGQYQKNLADCFQGSRS